MKTLSSCLLIFLLFSSLLSKAQIDGDVGKEPSTDADTSYTAGVEAALKHYHANKIADVTFLVSLLNPILGLVPAINGTSKKSPIKHIYTEESLTPEYQQGFLYQAKLIRKKKVWNNWLQGSAINLGLTAAVFTILAISFNTK